MKMLGLHEYTERGFNETIDEVFWRSCKCARQGCKSEHKIYPIFSLLVAQSSIQYHIKVTGPSSEPHFVILRHPLPDFLTFWVGNPGPRPYHASQISDIAETSGQIIVRGQLIERILHLISSGSYILLL